eukprot:5489901-Prymnesium_polylepis.2
MRTTHDAHLGRGGARDDRARRRSGHERVDTERADGERSSSGEANHDAEARPGGEQREVGKSTAK